MEDRYLFRAKRIDTDEWIIGSLLVDKQQDIETGEQIEIIGIYPSEYKDFAKKVDPSTVCQCTAMPDKNKKLVFEHDIVWDSDERAFYEIIWKQEDMCWNVEDADGHKSEFEECYGSTIEVNGNRFDNPELLEVQK